MYMHVSGLPVIYLHDEDFIYDYEICGQLRQIPSYIKEWNICKVQPDNRQDSRLACQLTFELSLYVFHLHIESINNLSTGVTR